MLQYSDTSSFNSLQFPIESSIKIYKDNINNQIELNQTEIDNNKLINEEHTLLGEIKKEGEKYYFIPFMNELDSDRETVNYVPWLIYSKQAVPEINEKYYLQEGDILKLGNSIFKIKLIQIGNFQGSNNKDNYDYENNEGNHALVMSGNSNHTLILNGQDNFNNIEESSMHKIIVYQDNKEKTEEKKCDLIENKNEIKKEKIKVNNICRICYQEEDDPLINPLIRPCKCSGSMKYIHLKCLLSWLKSRTIRQQNNIIENNDYFNSYFITKEIECELCKEPFPDFIKHNNIKYCLIDFDYIQENKIKKISNKLEQNFINTNNEIETIKEVNNDTNEKANNINYIIIDSIYPLNDGNKYRCIVKFNEENKIIIGRALENQLVLNEITVSRTHCILTIEKNKFGQKELKLEDYGSKFGTLILLQSNKYEIIKGKPFHFQIGNVHFSMNIPEQKSFFSCCNANTLENILSYENVNGNAVKKRHKINFLIERNSDDENDNEKDSKNQSINIKNKENIFNKENDSLKNKHINKNKVEENKNIQIDKMILKENKKNDLLLLKNKKLNFEDDNGKISREEDDENNDKDKDKRTVNIQIIKPKDIVHNVREANKNNYTSPVNRNISKKLLEMKTIEIPINFFKKAQKDREKDVESIVILEDECEKK